MAHTTSEAQPILAVTASGDKVIVFTPGKGVECRTEADVIRNEFGIYGLSGVEKSEKYPGWLTFSFSVDQSFGEEVLVVNVLMSDLEEHHPNRGMARMFSHLAIAYEGGAHVVAVQSSFSKRWYYNTSAPEFTDIY